MQDLRRSDAATDIQEKEIQTRPNRTNNSHMVDTSRRVARRFYTTKGTSRAIIKANTEVHLIPKSIVPVVVQYS